MYSIIFLLQLPHQPALYIAHLQTFSNPLPLPSLPAPQSEEACILTPSLPTLLAPLTQRSGARFPAPFILSKASTPIPGKLVAKIHFIDMRELLPDNIALMERLEVFPAHVGQAPRQKGTQREVASIRSWVCAFTTYVAILSEARPDLTKGRLAYLRNIVREAGRFGVDGWRTYNYAFRSQAAAVPAMDWSELNPSLLLAFMPTSLLPGNQPAKQPCCFCQEADHVSSHCALAPLAPPSTRPPPNFKSPGIKRSPSPQQQLCISWNQGACMMPGTCRYRHQCGTCGESHMARDCIQTTDDSVYKRPPKRAYR